MRIQQILHYLRALHADDKKHVRSHFQLIKAGLKTRPISKLADWYVRVLCSHSLSWTFHHWFGTVKLTADQERALAPSKNMCFYP